MDKVFITGINGFIGSKVSEKFLLEGFDVYGLVRKSSDLRFIKSQKINLIFGDLNDPESFTIPENIDYIVHSASTVSDTANDKTCRKNILEMTEKLTKKIINSKIKIKRFIYISTTLVLGYGKENISDQNPGISAEFLPYTRYKIKTEQYLRELNKSETFPMVIIRPADVMGPNDRTSSEKMLKAALKGAPLIVGHGKWKFALCYIDNLTEAIYMASKKSIAIGKSYNITNGIEITWRVYFEKLMNLIGKKQKIYVPKSIVLFLSGFFWIITKILPKIEPPITYYRYKRATTSSTYDISLTKSDLGYIPDQNTDQQIKNIVDWYMSLETGEK